jgi:hypothetical protein
MSIRNRIFGTDRGFFDSNGIFYRNEDEYNSGRPVVIPSDVAQDVDTSLTSDDRAFEEDGR